MVLSPKGERKYRNKAKDGSQSSLVRTLFSDLTVLDGKGDELQTMLYG